jgi:hypothetical protein
MVAQVGQPVTRVVEQASRALQSAVGYESVMKTAMEAVVPGLADLAVLMLDDESGDTRIEAIHRSNRCLGKAGEPM